MSNVVRFPKHKLHRCNGDDAHCQEGRCCYCSGGLAFCTTCKGGEGTLPTDCPGVEMDEDTASAVWDLKLDYVFPIGWVRPAHPSWRRYIP